MHTIPSNPLTWRILCGDAREKLGELQENSVQIFVTSPPYWAMRRYIDHDDEIGREDTLEAWIENLVEVFRAAKHSLRPDGLLWINCGDGYNAGTAASRQPGYGKHSYRENPNIDRRLNTPELKPKDLIGLPWRLTFALQADGWYLRSAIPWAKGVDWLAPEIQARETIRQALVTVRETVAGSLFGLSKDLDGALSKADKAVDWLLMCGAVMPESIHDRPTSSYEMLFLFSQSPHYFYDHNAIKVASSSHTNNRGTNRHTPKEAKSHSRIKANSSFHEHAGGRTFAARNARNVWMFPWRIPTEPKGAFRLRSGKIVSHFAAFPQALAERAIKAGTSEAGCCAKCYAPFKRVTKPAPAYAKHLGHDWADYAQDQADGRGHFDGANQRPVKRDTPGLTAGYETVGWVPTCTCYGEPLSTLTVCPKCGGTGKETVWLTAEEREAATMGREDGKVYTAQWDRAGKKEIGNPCPACLCLVCEGTGKKLDSRLASTESSYEQGTTGHRMSLLRQTARLAGQEYNASKRSVVTDEPCHSCEGVGATGYVNGKAWDDKTLDAWPRVPCVVGDMFVGSGTTLRAARALGRSSVGIDLSPDYCELAEERMLAWPGDVEQVRAKRKKKEDQGEPDPQLMLF